MGAIVYCVGVKEFNQTQVWSTEGYWRCCKYIKKTRYKCFILCLCVFVACNYCRHCGTCVSCVGRLPSPEGNHWLGMTHTYSMYTDTYSSTRNHINMQVNWLVTVFFSFCLISQIIKKSCIEILAAEPSSVCAGGKRCEVQGFPLLVKTLGSHGVRLCQMTVI